MSQSNRTGSNSARRGLAWGSIASGLVAVTLVLITAPTWPDGPVKSVALWAREGITQIWNDESQDIGRDSDDTTLVFRTSLSASKGYFTYVDNLPDDGLAAGLSPDDDLVSDLVEFLSRSIEQLTSAHATAGSELAKLDIQLDELEARNVKVLSGVSLDRVRDYGETVSQWGEKSVVSELAYGQCLLRALDQLPQIVPIGMMRTAIAESTIQCAAENPNDDAAEDELYSRMRDATAFLIESWAPDCLQPDVIAKTESIAEVISEIDCSG